MLLCTLNCQVTAEGAVMYQVLSGLPGAGPMFIQFQLQLYSPTLLVTLISRDALTAKGVVRCCDDVYQPRCCAMLEPISPPLSGTGSSCVDAGEVATLQLLDVSAPNHPFPPLRTTYMYLCTVVKQVRIAKCCSTSWMLYKAAEARRTHLDISGIATYPVISSRKL